MQPFTLISYRRSWQSYTNSTLPTHYLISWMQQRYFPLSWHVRWLCNVPQKIQKWFYNHYVWPKHQYTMFTHKWSSQSAFYQLNRDEVLQLARETSGLDLGASGFWGALQDATTVLWNALPADDQADYTQAAKEWSEDTPPSHVQSRWATNSSTWQYTPLWYLSIGWHPPWERGSFRTFSNICLRLVVFAPSFSQPTNQKTMISILDCKANPILATMELPFSSNVQGWCWKCLGWWNKFPEVLPWMEDCSTLGAVDSVWYKLLFPRCAKCIS